MRTRLREILNEKQMTGKELATKMGVSPQYINMLASGTHSMSIDRCAEIADILGVPLAAMFDGYDAPDTLRCPHCGKKIKIVRGED